MNPPGKFHIGTSGFSYKHWRGIFYPDDIPQKKWLEYYADNFGTVEINSSFYHIPRLSTCEGWERRSPEGFLFAIKANRYITHVRKLRYANEIINLFFTTIGYLDGKLGPVLLQLPPAMEKDIPLLKDFIARLPEGLRYVFEFRNSSWYGYELFRTLDDLGCAFCMHDLPGKATPREITGDFTYVRFHGSEAAYSSCYPDNELAEWADRLQTISAAGKDVFAYFNNDLHGHAVTNARTLTRLLAGT